MEEPRFVKRKVIAGDLKVDYDQRAVVVEYQVEAAVLNETGEVIQVDTRPHRKVIHLKKLDGNTNVDVLAQGIIDRCEMIHPSRLPKLIELLSDMQVRIVEEEKKMESAAESERRARRKAEKAIERQRPSPPVDIDIPKPKAVADISKLDEYMETLYDDSIDERVKGAFMMLQLARDPQYLQHILCNESLMGALSRTLMDEYKKSSDFALTVMQIFQCASQFDVFHELLAQYRAGDLALRIVEYEHNRHKFRRDELDKLTQLADAQARGDKELEAKIRKSVADVAAKAAAAKKDEKIKKEPSGKKERSDKKIAEDEDGKFGGDSPKKGSKKSKATDRKLAEEDDDSEKLLKLPEGTVDMATVTKRFKALFRKQEQLLLVCLSVLRNLAENLDTERKMLKRKLITFLVPLLARENEELLALSAEFLRKIALNSENLQPIVAENTVNAAMALANHGSDNVEKGALRLLFNLSFDKSIASTMATPHFLSSLVDKLKKTQFRAVALKLLYHMSKDASVRPMLVDTEAMSLTLRLIHGFPQNTLSPELIGLAINMFHCQEAVNAFCTPEAMKMLVVRTLKTRDSLLMKLLHNVSQWTRIQTEDETPDHPNPQKGIWSPFVKDLYRLARLSADSADMLVEVLGALANIGQSELPKTLTFTDLIKDNDMLALCQRLLVPGIAEDDVVLQVVMLLSVWQADTATQPLFQAYPRLPTLLVDVLGDKCEDAELVLQSAVVLEGFIVSEAFVSTIVYETQAVARFCDMMTHACPDVRSIAQHCLDVAIDHDRYVGKRGLWRQVQQRRFQLYNREYMAYLATAGGYGRSSASIDDGKWSEGEDNVSVDDEFDLSQWNPGSPGAIRAHGERLAMSPSDFSSPGVVYGDQLQPRRRF